MNDQEFNKPHGRLASRLDRIESKLEYLAKPVADEERRNAILMNRFVHALEHHWITRLLLLMFGIFAAATFYSFFTQIQIQKEEQRARLEEAQFRREAQIAQAWQTLLLPIGGNTGKGSAFTTIIDSGGSVDGIDLSCGNVGSARDGRCMSPPIFDFSIAFNASLGGYPSSSFKYASQRFENVSFDQSTIRSMTLQRAHFTNVSLRESTGKNWKLLNVTFDYDDYRLLDNFRCIDCAILESYLDWHVFKGAETSRFDNSVLVFPSDSEVTTSSRDHYSEYDPVTGDRFHIRNVFVNGIDVQEELHSLSSLPLIIRAAPHPEAAASTGRQFINSPAINSIMWEAYEEMSICLTEDEILEFRVEADYLEWFTDDSGFERARSLETGHLIEGSVAASYEPGIVRVAVESCGITADNSRNLKQIIAERLKDKFEDRLFFGKLIDGEEYFFSYDCDEMYDWDSSGGGSPPRDCFHPNYGGPGGSNGDEGR